MMTNTPFSLDVSFAFIIPGQYRGSQVMQSRKFNLTVTWNCSINKVKKIYVPYAPSDKYAYNRKQNITIE
jgi:hypothetical protein